jgi:4'-phosphopantetheinyl transferase EntD
LNRNQVKQMLDELPVTLLTGIPRMKAEFLQAQLTANDAVAEFRQLNS